MRYLFTLSALFISLLLLSPSTAHLQEQTQIIPLPTSDWYAVVWNPADDTLNWLNPTGTLAILPRPKLAGEMATTPPRITISPDGRSMVMIVDLIDGRQSIGFYQFSTGEYAQVHQTQIGERVANYGTSVSYNNQIALTLATSQTWRIISFDYTTGDPIYILNHDAPLAAVIPNVGGGVMPYIVHHLFDTTMNSQAIHFQIQARQLMAFVWYPEAGSLEPSDFITPNTDIRYNTDDALFTFNNMTYPHPPLTSLEGGGNAIGNGETINPHTIYADGNTMKSQPRWLAGGAWVGFYSQTINQSNWQVFANDGQSTQPITLQSDIFNIIGTPDGFLSIHTDGKITHTTQLQTSTSTTVYQPEIWVEDNLPQIVGVTPSGVRHTLTQIDVFHPPIIQDEVLTLETFIPVCDGTPPSRLVIGDDVQVVSSVPLKMRNVAGGNQVAEIAAGTTGQVINGAVCINGFLWWQIRWILDDGRTLEGWSAEGSLDEYFLAQVTDAPFDANTTEFEADETPQTTPVPLPTLPQLPFIPPTVTPSILGDG
jgi:hypothetical protein